MLGLSTVATSVIGLVVLLVLWQTYFYKKHLFYR